MWICIPKYWFTLFCREKFLSRIYALFGVPFTGLKNMVAYQKWQLSGMLFGSFCCSHKLLATYMNFLSLKSTFATFWQFLPMLAIFWQSLATFGNFWQLLPLMLPYHHVIKPSYHLVISSYFLLIILSSVSLIACKFVNLSIYQLVKLWAF